MSHSYIFFIAAIILFWGCSDKNSTKEQKKVNNLEFKEIWFKQANVDLGNRIKVNSLHEGFAVSNGRGEIPGRIYQLNNGTWKPFFSYPYSDFPLIQKSPNNSIWVIHHLVHSGYCRPVLEEFKDTLHLRSIPLPQVMWDASDYVMFKCLWIQEDAAAYLAGQQGKILYFDSKKWNEISSPINKDTLQTLLDGDINDLQMTGLNRGWAVGKAGVILRCIEGKWSYFPSPTDLSINKISLLNDSTGFAVGQRGLILRLNSGKWNIEKSPVQFNLSSIKILSADLIFAVGDNSTFLRCVAGQWLIDESIKIYEDNFKDIDVLQDDHDKIHIWIIGSEGIYSNTQDLGFSFTDITSVSGLPEYGKAGIFFNDAKNRTNLLLLNESSPMQLYRYENGLFANVTHEAGLKNDIIATQYATIGDVNNDGYPDLFIVLDAEKYKLYFGNADGEYEDRTEYSSIKIPDITRAAFITTTFLDFDNDGAVDLFVGDDLGHYHFLKNDGTGKFSLIKNQSKSFFPATKVFGVTFSDFNNDGLIDIFLPFQTPVDNKICRLVINQGNFNFIVKEIPSFQIENKQSYSGTVAIAEDIDNNSTIDLILHFQKRPPIVFLNDGKANFSLPKEQFFKSEIFHPEFGNGIMNTGDVNNDGWEDIFIGSKLFINEGGKSFKEISEPTGINFTGSPVFYDVDKDGDLDLFLGSQKSSLGKGQRTAFYRNNLNNKNYINVACSGDWSNRLGTGTTIEFTPLDNSGQHLFTKRKIIGGGSNPFIPQSITAVHFGIGQNRHYLLKTTFPSGRVVNQQGGEAVKNVIILEHTPVRHQLILLLNYINRKLIQTNTIHELIILLFLLSILAVYFRYGSVSKDRSSFRSVYPYMILLFIYLVTFFSIDRSEETGSFIISISSLLCSATVLFVVLSIIDKKRNAQTIGHFRIEKLIGKGGMGAVYSAIDTLSKNKVALKILEPTVFNDPDNKKRFYQEGQILSSFNHPNIIRVIELGESNGKGFIALELMKCGTLQDYIHTHHPLDESEIKKYSMEILNGLKEIHRTGVVHRDLKTANIMINADGVLKIMDFGLSRSTLISSMSTPGTVLGTLGYTAPEQITNSQIDHRADIFSFGVILYEMILNEHPFKGDNEIALIHSIFSSEVSNVFEKRQDINQNYNEIIQKCLEKNPENRFQNIEVIESILNMQ